VTENRVPPHLEPESIRIAARPPALAPALVTQRQLQPFVETMPDGTRVLYRTDGTPIRQCNVDGSIVALDARGRPQTQTTADGPDHPSPGPAPTVAGTALVVDRQDSQGRPVGVTFPDGTRARYEYEPDGGRVVHYSTGVVTAEDRAGRVLAERLPDGKVLTSFDSKGRPIGRTASGGQPLRAQQPVDGTALPPGVSAVVDPGGKTVRQVTSDGAEFDGQGSPTSVSSPGGAQSTTTYDAKGDSSQQPSDSRAVQPSPGGHAVPPVAPGAAAPDKSTQADIPTSGTTPDGMHFTTTYDAKGDAFEHLADGTTVEYSPTGEVIRQVAPDGTVIDGFDGQGRPTSGATADGTHFTTTYDAKGDTFQHFGDGTTVEYDPQGHPLTTWTAEGAEITWAVDLPALANAATRVATEQQVISNAASSLSAAFTRVEGIWDGPAGATLVPLASTFNTVTDQLVALLDDAVNRMRTAYQNYVSTETTNTSNLQ
jgi:YD repeat-containing protein